MAEEKRQSEQHLAERRKEIAQVFQEIRQKQDDLKQKQLADEQKRRADEQKLQLNELARWKQLKIGMTKSQIEKILGKPTSLDTDSYFKSETWHYPTPKGFWTGGTIKFQEGKLSSWDAPPESSLLTP